MAKAKPKTKPKALAPRKTKATPGKSKATRPKGKKRKAPVPVPVPVPAPAPSVRITLPAFGQALQLDPTGTFYTVNALHTFPGNPTATSWIILDASVGPGGTLQGTLVGPSTSPVTFQYPAPPFIATGGNHVLYVRIDDGNTPSTDDILVQGP